MSYSLIVFDWNGTLSHMPEVPCQEFAQEKPSRHHVPPVVMKRKIPAHTRHASVLFPGVETLLKTLCQQGYLLAIASHHSRRSLDAELHQHRLEDQFIATRTLSECLAKPNPDMLLSLMQFAGVDAERTVMIGDSEGDMLCAQNAGIDAIGVDGGSGNATLLTAAGAKTVLSSITQLITYLEYA